ncbi:MAG: response regulator transcription factor [Desulfohalobiaceae bacterium]|nr:response regulator transcription factor [Desulfohalobiaceae bacterium]
MSSEVILIVEDEVDILNLLQYTFENEGFVTHGFVNGEEALEQAADIGPDIIVLDLMLPGMDGLKVCHRLKTKTRTRDIPLIMLTAKSEVEDRITGLEHGADDYLSKPFSPRELVLRVKGLLRRKGQIQNEASHWQSEGLSVDFDSFLVKTDKEEVSLTSTEFNILSSLIRSRGRVLNREQLLDQVWGYDFEGYARTVDTHMHRLRHKLGAYGDWIETVRGIGYRFKPKNLPSGSNQSNAET